MVPVGFESFNPLPNYLSGQTSNRAEHLCETLKGTTQGILQIRTFGIYCTASNFAPFRLKPGPAYKVSVKTNFQIRICL